MADAKIALGSTESGRNSAEGGHFHACTASAPGDMGTDRKYFVSRARSPFPQVERAFSSDFRPNHWPQPWLGSRVVMAMAT